MRGTPFADYLDTLSHAERLVPDELDRRLLADAAAVIRTRLAEGVNQPIVVIVHGPEYDPVAFAVDDLQCTLSRLADEIATFDEQLDGVRRQLTHRNTQSTATTKEG